jgi:hypothetical protein
MLYISLASLGATTAIALSLIVLHLRRYRAPKVRYNTQFEDRAAEPATVNHLSQSY